MNRPGVKCPVAMEECMRSVQLLVLLSLGACSLAAGADSVYWNQFRGPNGAGMAAGFRPPLQIEGSPIMFRNIKLTPLN